MQHTYKIVLASGDIVYTVANSRTEAIEKYLSQSGMPKDFFKKHCLIVRKKEA